MNDRAVSQVLAQTIVNAFSEVNMNSTLSSCFIPSFLATSRAIRLIMYNCDLDSLIMSEDLKLFIVENNQVSLDVSTILSIWNALNFQNNFDKTKSLSPEFQAIHHKSNFREQAGKKFGIYKEKCTKPMTESKAFVDVDFKVLGSCLYGSIGCEIETTLASIKQSVHEKANAR